MNNHISDTVEMNGEVSKIKIVYIHHAKAIGGAPLSLLYLVQGLDDELYDPVILCVHEGAAAQLFREHGIKVVIGPGYGRLKHVAFSWYKIRHLHFLTTSWIGSARVIMGVGESYLSQLGPDIVHLNAMDLVPWAMAAKALGIPVVSHVREPMAPGYIGIRKRIYSKLLRDNCNEIVAISEYDRQEIGAPSHSRVVYNFVDFELFDRFQETDQIRSQLGITNEEMVVLYVGGINRTKGAMTVIESAQRVRDSGLHGIQWLVAGYGADPDQHYPSAISRQGRYQREYWDYFNEHNLQDVVKHIGVRKDIHEVMAAADVVVFPSSEPHFARPLIEAAALAKVGIGSDFPEIREIVIDEQTGFVVPAGDSEAIAVRVATLLENPDYRRQLGENAYRRALEMFDATRNVQETVEVYSEILQN